MPLEVRLDDSRPILIVDHEDNRLARREWSSKAAVESCRDSAMR